MYDESGADIMIAAIYARKSTKDTNEEKSVERQEVGAREFIASRGWSLDDAHIYTDDKKSGALFLGRPGFQNMLRDAAAGAFDVVVMFDLDRFGRHGQKSMEALNALADAGVEVYDYSTGQQVDLDSFEGETSAWLKTRMAQQFRDQIRKHTRAAMRRKAELGWHTHGKVSATTRCGLKRATVSSASTKLKQRWSARSIDGVRRARAHGQSRVP
jgi:DNA invertase Pin-like site-specific DNA recombinase